VATLADAVTVVEAVEGGHVDLLITNSVMSGDRGAKLVARVRELHPHLPILHIDDDAYLPPDDFPREVPRVSKPFSRDLLLEQVRTLLSRPTD
jgi:two-component SAPR family response regulator